MNAQISTNVQRYSAREIAEALGISKSIALRQARNQSWPFEEVAVRGGKKRLYRLADLPCKVARKVAATHAVKTIKKTIPIIPESFFLVVDGDVFEVRRLPA